MLKKIDHTARTGGRHGLRTWLAAGSVAVGTLAAAGGFVLAGQTSALAATPSFPAHYAAPYLQVSGSDVGDMAADYSATGLKYYTLAFLTPSSATSCTPTWEDGGEAMNSFTSQVGQIQADGGDVIISFGGEPDGNDPNEIAQTCTSVSSLTAAYLNVVQTYGVTRLDFDIEGSVLADTSATTRRDEALAALQKEDPSVQVDFTLAVDPNGLPTGTASEYALLQDAKAQGVNVNLVNIMTMDYYDNEAVLPQAESSAEDTAAQLASLYGISTSAAYAKLGLTPIAGTNDDGEVFSQANASSLESFAASNGVQELAFWEIDGYDKGDGYAYSKIFNAITSGSSGGGGGTTGAGTIVGTNSGLCLSVSGDSSALKSTADISTCDGDTYEKWTVESNGTIVNGDGQCLSVTGASTSNYATADLYTCNGSVSENWTES